MAVDDGDTLEPEVILESQGGPQPLTPALAAAMLQAWLTDNWDATAARFVCRVGPDGVVIEHHEETTFRRREG